MNLFDEYKALFNGEDINLSSPYMINRLLSLSKEAFSISTKCNKYIGRIPNDLLVLIYQSSIKSKRAPYVKYPKKPKVKDKELIQQICQYYNCNEFYAKQIIAIYIGKKINPNKIFGVK